jgi:hypothetical protein
MKSLWALSTQALSRLLDSREREIVLGDLAELGMSDPRAFKGVLGLVLRRQLGLWKEWQPWFVLVAIVVPIGPLLATQSDRLGLTFFPNLEMWFHNGISYRSGVSSAALFAEFCFQASALVTWSWTSAFALGALSRKTIWPNGFLFFVLCAVFAVDRGFYSVRFLWVTPWAWTPIVSNFLIVLLPAYLGLRKSAKSPRTTPPWMIPLAVWTVIMGGLAFWTQGWYDAALDNWSHGAPALTLIQLAQRADVWEAFAAHLLQLAVLTGPIVYLLAMNGFSHRRSRICRA